MKTFKRIVRGALAASLLCGVGGSASADGSARRERIADRIERRGDRVEKRLDERGDRLERRWDRRGERFERRADRKASRIRKR